MLSSQATARTGNALGGAGVLLGLAATAGPRLATASGGLLTQAAVALGARILHQQLMKLTWLSTSTRAVAWGGGGRRST